MQVIYLNQNGTRAQPDLYGRDSHVPTPSLRSCSKVPVWEWCKLNVQKLKGLTKDAIKEDAWQAYPQDICDQIETAYGRKHTQAEVEIGGRCYTILFEGGAWSELGGPVQLRPRLNKVREVRRRLLPRDHALALMESASIPIAPRTISEITMPGLDTDDVELEMEDRMAGLIPLWQWCMRDARQLENKTWCELSDDDWGVYSSENSDQIEQAYQDGKEMVQVTVGIRQYQIIFNPGSRSKFGGTIQVDPERHKVREVRRLLVNQTNLWYANAPACSDEQCAICYEEFAQTTAMPTIRLACSHLFHCACAQRLADLHGDCPLCRGKVSWGDISSLSPPGSNQPDGEVETDPFQLGLRLLVAADRGNLSAVQEALAMRVDVNSRSRLGATPLMSASLFGHRTVVEELLRARADTNLATNDGNTALLMAARCGHFDIVRRLLTEGADVRPRNSAGFSAADIPQVQAMSSVRIAL